MGPDDERHESEKDDRVHHRAIAPQRLPRVVGDDLGHDTHRGQDEHVDLGMREKPEQVLPQNRVAAARPRRSVGGPGHPGQDAIGDDQAARQEKTRPGETIHQLQHAGRFKRWERQKQKKGGHELRPYEEGQPHVAEALGSQLDDRDDEVHRTEERRRDQEDHAEKPACLTDRRNHGEGRIRRPSRLCCAARQKKLASIVTPPRKYTQ